MNNLAKRFIHITAWFAMALAPAASRAADGSSLKPPPGARVAIVVFEDMECPDCARAYPVIWEAAKKHNIPVVLHDFPLQMHPWSFEAAVFARYFDSKSQKLGDDFRGFIFQNQQQIDKQNLRQWADKFASTNNSPIPFVLDPDGQFKTKILADRQMGTQIGLQHTPTLYVVSNKRSGTPFVEVVDRSQLFQLIDTMKKE